MISREQLLELESEDVIIETTYGSVLRGSFHFMAGDEMDQEEDKIGIHHYQIIQNSNPAIQEILDAGQGLSISASKIKSIRLAA